MKLFDVVLVVAIWTVIVAWLLNLIEKVKKTNKPLTMEDVFDLARMIVAQLDVLENASNVEKKAKGVDALRSIMSEQKGAIAQTVASNPVVASGLIEMAVDEQHNRANGAEVPENVDPSAVIGFTNVEESGQNESK